MKRYEYKIYNKAGSYLTTWRDVISLPNFDQNINGGLGDLTVTLKRPFSNFGEGNDVWFENKLRLEVYDKENPDGKLIYTGRLNEYKPYFGDEEKVEVSFVGYVTELDDRYLRDETSNDAIDGYYLLPSGVLTKYRLRQQFNPDPDSGFTAMAHEFVATHNTITAIGIQAERAGIAMSERYITVGIMDGDTSTGYDQLGNLLTYTRPGRILASGILDTNLIPSGINTATQQYSTVVLPRKVYVEPGKKYYAFIAGGNPSLPMYSTSDNGWESTKTSWGWNYGAEIALDAASYTNTNASSYLEGMGNIRFFSNTSPRYNSEDPTDIMEDIIKNKYSGTITWDESNQLTGYTVSYQFNKTRTLDAIKKCHELTDPNWYWFIGAENKLSLRERDYNVIAHTLRLGYEIKSASPTKTVNELKTRTLFSGGVASGQSELYDEEDWWWQNDQYSLREHLIQDGRVTQRDTAKQLERTYLDAHYRPVTYMSIEVLDSNTDKRDGYDIESFAVGQFVRIIDPSSDNYNTQDGILEQGFILEETPFDISDTHILSEPLQILKINYRGQSATLSLGTILVDTPRRIEDIYRGQQSENTKNTPLS